MNQQLPIRRTILALLALAVGLPLVQGVLFWIGHLLNAMGDEAGHDVCGRLLLVCGGVWLLSLVALVVVLAISHLAGRED